jgi:hypothetical protein
VVTVIVLVVDVALDAAVERSDYVLGCGTRVTKMMEELLLDASVPENAGTKSSSPCCTYTGSSKCLIEWAVPFTVCRKSIERPFSIADR